MSGDRGTSKRKKLADLAHAVVDGHLLLPAVPEES
jgi:hypothetical protein